MTVSAPVSKTVFSLLPLKVASSVIGSWTGWSLEPCARRQTVARRRNPKADEPAPVFK
jgi:hypothetical protein